MPAASRTVLIILGMAAFGVLLTITGFFAAAAISATTEGKAGSALLFASPVFFVCCMIIGAAGKMK